ncbi:MAG TPA: ATP-binding protein [Thermoanaerobaculia bacterium]|nr:ATP-binding protein [Thermoanaerobaculia bacterium]
MTVAESIDARYEQALLQYLNQPEESALLGGYELGRTALSNGLGVLEMATVHQRAVVSIFTHKAYPQELGQLLTSQTAFFIEALSPFEMAHRAFRDANTMLRRLNDMLEGQARRIASALHSEAGQLLATVHLELANAGQGAPPASAEHLSTVRTLLVDIETRLRNLSHELRPPVLEDLGLAAALELLAETVSKRWGLAVSVKVELKGDLPATIENTIYRIVQEALSNTAKHADARNVEIDLHQVHKKIVCSVKDDGVGFDNTAGFRKRRPGLGLTEIRESVAALGGAVRLGLNHDRGTDLTIELPMDA